MADSGRHVLVKCNAGSKSAPRYIAVAQQQGLELQSQRNTTSVGHKDSPSDVVILGTITHTVTFNGLRVRSDEGLALLRRALRTGEDIQLQIFEYDNPIREYVAKLTSLNESFPHDGPMTYSATASPVENPIDL